MSDEESEYEVERIVGEKTDSSGTKLYKVKWLGYSDKFSEWVPVENMNCPDLIDKWNRQKHSTTSASSKKRRRSSMASLQSKSKSVSSSVDKTSIQGHNPRSTSNSPSLQTPKQNSVKKSMVAATSGDISSGRRISFGSASQKVSSQKTTPNSNIREGSSYSNLLKENSNLKVQLQKERAIREALEKKIRERIERCETLKKDIALIKFNMQLAGIRSSAAGMGSSSSDSSDDSDA